MRISRRTKATIIVAGSSAKNVRLSSCVCSNVVGPMLLLLVKSFDLMFDGHSHLSSLLLISHVARL